MKKKTIIGAIIITAILAVIVRNTNTVAEPVVYEKVEEVVELSDREAKALEIYNSPEFQAEMKTTALARALYQMSVEASDLSVELAKDAQVVNQLAEEKKAVWFTPVVDTTK